ncbi:LysR family transcriptional regulator [Tunturiibacter gelidoferens]|uniref:DNA-binding transcriptional LysR family regulator n=1 Tax=Tunturiibacter gelidiferens TaxID=3069689 RepID=A0ACC5NT90_9BACT|nr:LysR family transcriptional regulator [Edaphobacter lichenicola]MBB5337754.1 DNA-binding transcriptional LysR family regulator [Edaphobacter lichenicola]
MNRPKLSKPPTDRLLSGISVLMAVVEGGSFIRAAEALGITQPAVSRSIARLESRVGVRLLDRTTRSLTLTAEGRRLYEETSPLLTGIADAVTFASGSSATVRGRLRVNMDPLFSSLLLAPHLGGFLDRYPEVSLELLTRPELGDLISEGFDLAVRFGEPPSSSLVARKLLKTHIVTVAAPSYLARHGRPEKLTDLAKHHCLQFRDPRTNQPYEWEFHRGRRIVPIKTSGRLMLSDPYTFLAACVAGAGIAQVLALSVQTELDRGDLIDIFPNWPDERFPLFALYPSRHLPPAKLRAFLDFVLELANPPSRPQK